MALFDNLGIEKEKWADVVGFEGVYQISNRGMVRDANKEHVRYRPYEDTTYIYAALSRDGKPATTAVHTMVAQAFVANPDPEHLTEVVHKDGNIHNNKSENLKWVTKEEYATLGLEDAATHVWGRPVVCLETGEEFKSLTAAGRSLGVSTEKVEQSIKKMICCEGKTFVYANSMPENPKEYMELAKMRGTKSVKRNFGKPVNTTGRKVRIVETGQVFDTMFAAAQAFGVDTKTISNRIEAAHPFNGCTFVFEKEEDEE